ncbi:hypothetical protein RJ639_025172, partial [Escallonia herrerae]
MHNQGDLSEMPYDLEVMAKHVVDYSQGQLVDINIEYFGSDELLEYIVLLMAFAGSYNHSIIQNSFGNSFSCCFGFESLSLDLAPGGVGCVFIEWLQHADVKDGMELAAPPMRRINF